MRAKGGMQVVAWAACRQPLGTSARLAICRSTEDRTPHELKQRVGRLDSGGKSPASAGRSREQPDVREHEPDPKRIEERDR